MKITTALSLCAAVVATLSAAAAAASTPSADVVVLGAKTTLSPSSIAVRVATKDLLNNPTALINKNTLAADNNVFIARSNLLFTQSDRLAMREKVQEALKATATMTAADLADPATTVVLTKNVMRAVSAPSDDKALMAKASAVVAAKGSDAISQKIADFVDAVGTREMENEQALQSKTPRGVIVLVGTKDILRQPTAVVNKNFVMSGNQVTIARSTIAPTQNDQILLRGSGTKVADAIAPAASIRIGTAQSDDDSEASDDDDGDDDDGDDAAKSGVAKMKMKSKKESEAHEADQYRVAFAYPTEQDTDQSMGDAGDGGDEDMEKKKKETKKPTTSKKEQFGLLGGCGLGWRYPLGWWNTFGAGLYGGGCGLGLAAGPFFYC